MPLLDHFHPPLQLRRRWGSFHGSWATHIAERLNEKLIPAGFVAETQVKLGVSVEADVGALDEERIAPPDGNGAVATAVWAPPKPALIVPVDLAGIDRIEVQVYDEETARTLVAAVELVSPANKDRATHRQAFVTKCTALLQEEVMVVVVDVVTSRRHNFHAALMEAFGGSDEARRAVTSDLYAVAYRPAFQGTRGQLDVWPAELALGAALPTLPLWLRDRLVVPLDLEATYQETCKGFGIRP